MIEADLQREYRIDLCDLWRGKLTPRRLWTLLDGLPIDSPAAFALAGITGEVAQWTRAELLVGRLVDEVSAHRWEWGYAHTPKKDRGRYPKAPKSVLPKDELRAAQQADAAEIPVISPSRLGEFLDAPAEQLLEQKQGR